MNQPICPGGATDFAKLQSASGLLAFVKIGTKTTRDPRPTNQVPPDASSALKIKCAKLDGHYPLELRHPFGLFSLIQLIPSSGSQTHTF